MSTMAVFSITNNRGKFRNSRPAGVQGLSMEISPDWECGSGLRYIEVQEKYEG
ncbi:hypothetical protein PSTG_10454 [Puccinia striiformis f. sp. tritici PST-78]|uniref:Uncharacterized protein n=1 Tax=Puccinia striiformis f. sp. tritici PST-78 TaxID=1165861 RepID=A0A0L0VB07_9BASI|nr:hypothetical protein PSTG_10454 [Puccinia striiformis f. sp. tritici PST-78]